MLRHVITCCIVALLQALSGGINSKLCASAAHMALFKPEDFVIVINTDQQRFKLALASRPLRYGLPVRESGQPGAIEDVLTSSRPRHTVQGRHTHVHRA